MSVGWVCPINPGSRAVRFSVARGILYGLLISVLGFRGAGLCAQEIKIKLIDGRNGQPLGNNYVNVWVGHDRKEATAIPVDSNGIATLRLTSENSGVDRSHQWSRCGLFGVIHPVLKYHDDIGLILGYVLCQADSGDYSWLEKHEYATRDLVQTGIVTPNTCGKATAERKPGELIIFARPLTWWERWKE
jgi:hypothetical protein